MGKQRVIALLGGSQGAGPLAERGTDSQGGSLLLQPFSEGLLWLPQPVFTEDPEGERRSRFASVTLDSFVNPIWKRVWISLVYESYK